MDGKNQIDVLAGGTFTFIVGFYILGPILGGIFFAATIGILFTYNDKVCKNMQNIGDGFLVPLLNVTEKWWYSLPVLFLTLVAVTYSYGTSISNELFGTAIFLIVIPITSVAVLSIMIDTVYLRKNHSEWVPIWHFYPAVIVVGYIMSVYLSMAAVVYYLIRRTLTVELSHDPSKSVS